MPHEPEWIEAYLDGELGPAETAALETELKSSAELRHQLELAREIRSGLRSLPEVDLSAVTLKRVLRQASEQPQHPPEGEPVRRLAATVLALAATVAAAVLGLAIWRGLDRGPEVDPAEVARAAAETKWALAEVDRLVRKAGARAGDEVLNRYLVAPTRRGASAALLLPHASEARDTQED